MTLTTLYNALETVRHASTLSPKDRDIVARGRVRILQELHDHLDTAVLQAYDLTAGLRNADIIAHLVDLNAKTHR
ncbi:MAG: hypothetical protein WDN06_09410 [Asticcacaulis sp.]